MTITNQANYALRAMTFLAKTNDNKWVSSDIIAKEMSIPRMFLSRINMLLVKAGLIVSRRGAGGGVKLAKKPDQISVYEVLSAIDGPLIIDKSLGNSENQDFPMADKFKSFFQSAQDLMEEKLTQTNLEELIEAE